MPSTGFDVIGDVHGHATPLKTLLRSMGYLELGQGFRHSSRMAVFVGDLIDRGPQIRETLKIVSTMVESGDAIALLGNHELNALAFHTTTSEGDGSPLRSHSPKHVRQHAATLEQLEPKELKGFLGWFRTLPLWLETPHLRVVHACWDPAAVNTLAPYRTLPLTDDFLRESCKMGGAISGAIETLLKGKEVALPHGCRHTDSEGVERDTCRVKWYASSIGHSYRTYALASETVSCDRPLPPEAHETAIPYPEGDVPVFFGHYGLRTANPAPLTPNVACVDGGIATGGALCAFRWEGQDKLVESGFATVQQAHR
jgi:hypothetical protein